MPPRAKTPAFAYVRVSSTEQIIGDGFARQRDGIRLYAQACGYQLVEEFTDGAVSGTQELKHRPGLMALFERIRESSVRVVLVENSDRLARDTVPGEAILIKFRDYHVRVFDASGFELTDTTDPTKMMMRKLLAVIAEFNKNLLVHRLAAARARQLRETGRCGGRHPFGHHAHEQPTLDAIRALHRKRLSGAAIAAQLNADGAPTRTGVPWSGTAVNTILTRLARRRRTLPKGLTPK